MFPLPLDNIQQLRLRSDDSDVHASKSAGPAFYRCSHWLVPHMPLISTAAELLRGLLLPCFEIQCRYFAVHACYILSAWKGMHTT